MRWARAAHSVAVPLARESVPRITVALSSQNREKKKNVISKDLVIRFHNFPHCRRQRSDFATLRVWRDHLSAILKCILRSTFC